MIRRIQVVIKVRPPIGVIGPKNEQSNPSALSTERRYIEPENKVTPIVKPIIMNDCKDTFPAFNPSTNKAIPWYIW